MSMPVCSGILFDLDGVLVHSSAAVSRSWRRWAAENGLPVTTVEQSAHGRRTVDTVRVLAPHLDAAAEATRLEAEQARDTEGITAGTGAAALLEALEPTEWAVVTSGTRPLALARLAAAGLPRPGMLIAGDDVTSGKPSPEGYLRGAAALGHPPERCLVIEDAAAGIQAARSAGAFVIGVTNGGEQTHLAGADAIVQTLADLQLRREPDGGIVLDAASAARPGSPAGRSQGSWSAVDV
ncbi:HAD-IA family hydrolase [Nonomuraea sp. NPDC026600]|uniref:HAD-IA family hydrolase n=1 Tax=Nonomuraea sp. NPDC026600 TaxID=3155363 RepID=UPI0033C26290